MRVFMLLFVFVLLAGCSSGDPKKAAPDKKDTKQQADNKVTTTPKTDTLKKKGDEEDKKPTPVVVETPPQVEPLPKAEVEAAIKALIAKKLKWTKIEIKTITGPYLPPQDMVAKSKLEKLQAYYVSFTAQNSLFSTQKEDNWIFVVGKDGTNVRATNHFPTKEIDQALGTDWVKKHPSPQS